MKLHAKKLWLRLLAIGFAIFTSTVVHAQANPPQSCPADPLAAMASLQQQIDALYLNVRTDVKVAAEDLKIAVQAGDPGQIALKIGYYEEVLFQYETQAHLLYEQVREINRCWIRSGKYLLWVSIEQVTQVWTKTYIKVIKTTVTWFKKIYKVKVLGIVNTSTVGCCECNGVADPPITNCASAPGLTAPLCNTACLPFASNGNWHFQQMCDAATGTCVPDP